MYRYSLLFLGLILLVACTGDPAQKNAEPATTSVPKTEEKTENKVDARKIVLFFGNSLTAGYGLELEEAFPALIQKQMDSLGLDFRVVNSGVSGDTSADGLGRIKWVLSNFQDLEVFVLELGANDGLRGLQLNQTRENLQAIIDQVKTTFPKVRILIAGMEVPPNLGQEYAEEFRNIFTELAQINQTALIPFLLDGVGGEKDLNQGDGIHPTAEGHKHVAGNVWNVLKDIL